MRKIYVLLIFLILLGASFLSGCINFGSDKDDEDDDTTPDVEIENSEAYEILMDEIIQPGSSDAGSSSFMLSKMLEPGDVITSEGGTSYTIDENSWFIFIDDAPWAFFAHPTRFVIINAETGETTTINDYWPPLINNASLWNNDSHGRGDVTNIYPILNKSVPITTDIATGAPSADYGDAPDTQNAYYGITGAFPTYYNTTNSRVGYPGGHTLTVGEETLGFTVSAEVDANDPNDPDLIPNLVDSDKDDRMFVSVGTQNAKLSFTVDVDQSAPDVPRYINVLIDFDQNGSWMDGDYGPEWAVVNYEINVTPGTSKTITTPMFAWGNKSILPSPVWVRVSLTRTKVNQTLFSTVGGWDGSGQFDYGEIEDHIVYLTDDTPEPEDEWPPWPKEPPTGGDPDPKPPTGPQPPGPTTGPCGTDVNYHCIIINGGDSCSHLSKGLTPASEAVDTMTDLLGDQGYNTVDSLGPGGNSMAAITQAFENLKSQVQCGDHVLIYIIGHGKPSSKGGGVTLRGTDGKTDETMKPSDLADLLGSIPACPDEDCDTPGKCCHVTVVIESCYAGNFNVDGVKGPGRTVMGSCDDEPADASGGGVFTSGFSAASNDENNDANDDGAVTPQEAFEKAEDNVEENNDRTGRSQEPWSDSQECECKCPCSPSIDVDKWVWDDDDWDLETDAYLGDTVLFLIDILNDGECRNVSELELVDTLPSCLGYGYDGIVTYINSQGQETQLSMSPTMSDTPSGGLELTWDIGSEIGLFAPDESIEIEYSATTLELGENINFIDGSARCTYDDSIVVTDSDSATVNVLEEPEDALPPVESVMLVFAEGNSTTTGIEGLCTAVVTISSYGATDLSGGDYPITNVVLEIDGDVKHDSGTINTTHYDNSYEMPAECSTTYTINVIATNSIGQTLTYSGTITTQDPPILVLETTIHAYAPLEYGEVEGVPFCNTQLNIYYNATDLTGGDYPVTNVVLTLNGIEIQNHVTSEIEFRGYEEQPASCYTEYVIQMTATNSNGQSGVVTVSLTPSPPT